MMTQHFTTAISFLWSIGWVEFKFNPHVVKGGGVKLPPGRSFCCRSVTTRNFGKRFGDFSSICFV